MANTSSLICLLLFPPSPSSPPPSCSILLPSPPSSALLSPPPFSSFLLHPSSSVQSSWSRSSFSLCLVLSLCVRAVFVVAVVVVMVVVVVVIVVVFSLSRRGRLRRVFVAGRRRATSACGNLGAPPATITTTTLNHQISLITSFNHCHAHLKTNRRSFLN